MTDVTRYMKMITFAMSTGYNRLAWHKERGTTNTMLSTYETVSCPDVEKMFDICAVTHIERIVREMSEEINSLDPQEATTRTMMEIYRSGLAVGRMMEEIQVLEIRRADLLVTYEDFLAIPGDPDAEEDE